MNETGTPQIPNYPDLIQLKGRGIVVLGAGQGIGLQVTHALAQVGAQVLCVDRDEKLAEAAAAAVGGHACAADVTNRLDMERIFDIARLKLGRVQGVVDVVGVATIKPLADMDDAAWEGQFDIVLRHAFLAVQIGGRALAEGGGGALTFVGSLSGSLAFHQQIAYGTAKAALHHLVRTASLELAPRNVRINAVSPGFIRTPRLNLRLDEGQWAEIARHVPLGRAATPAEIAAPLLFLTSDLASHVTGQVLNVDGGMGNVAAIPQMKFAHMPVPNPPPR